MITGPSAEVLLVVAAILLALMFCQWLIGSMSRRYLDSQRPQRERQSSTPGSFHRAAIGVSRRAFLSHVQER